jgi:IS30 family transposase
LVLDRAKAEKLHAQGWSVRKIAVELGVSAATAHRIVRRRDLQPIPPVHVPVADGD